MNQVTVEKGIAIPVASRATKYPWDKMEIGDSFFMDVSVTSASAAASNARKRYGFFYTVRAENAGSRVWRCPPYEIRQFKPKTKKAKK